MIAANSGLPCGALGINGLDHWQTMRTRKYKTQEEDVVQKWFLNEERLGVDVKDLYRQIFCSPPLWGMKYKTDRDIDWKDNDAMIKYVTEKGVKLEVVDGASTGELRVRLPNGKVTNAFTTVQNKIYVHNDDEHLYEDAWLVKNARVHEDYSATLAFVAGPNTGAPGRSKNISSTTRRTYNAALTQNYDAMKLRLQNALRHGLQTMRNAGVKVAVVPLLGAGLYCKDDWTSTLRNQYGEMLLELQEEVNITVIFSNYSPPGKNARSGSRAAPRAKRRRLALPSPLVTWRASNS